MPSEATTGATAETTLLLAGRVYVAPAEVEELVAEARQTMPLAQANPGCQLISFTLGLR